MIHEETIQKLLSLRLGAMAQAVREMSDRPPDTSMSAEDHVAMIVEREYQHRQNARLARRLKEANLTSSSACLEDVACDPARGIDKAMVRGLTSCNWVTSKQNIIVIGATGVGKSYLAAALVNAACRQGHRAFRMRAVRLVEELAIARADGSFASRLGKLANVDVLVLDDFLIAPMKESERRDLLEVLEDRYDIRSTIITTQLPTRSWHEALGDPTIADAICDRVVHNAHVITLKGQSMRKKKALTENT